MIDLGPPQPLSPAEVAELDSYGELRGNLPIPRRAFDLWEREILWGRCDPDQKLTEERNDEMAQVNGRLMPDPARKNARPICSFCGRENYAIEARHDCPERRLAFGLASVRHIPGQLSRARRGKA